MRGSSKILNGCALAVLGGMIGFFGSVLALMLITGLVVLVTHNKDYLILGTVVGYVIAPLAGLTGLVAGPSIFRRNEDKRDECRGFPVNQPPVDKDGLD